MAQKMAQTLPFFFPPIRLPLSFSPLSLLLTQMQRRCSSFPDFPVKLVSFAAAIAAPPSRLSVPLPRHLYQHTHTAEKTRTNTRTRPPLLPSVRRGVRRCRHATAPPSSLSPLPLSLLPSSTNTHTHAITHRGDAIGGAALLFSISGEATTSNNPPAGILITTSPSTLLGRQQQQHSRRRRRRLCEQAQPLYPSSHTFDSTHTQQKHNHDSRTQRTHTQRSTLPINLREQRGANRF